MYFLISTYSNFLTISLRENGKLIEKSIPVDATILNDSEIKNLTEFTKILFNALYDLKGGTYKQIPIIFLTDPIKNHFRFIKSQKELSFDNQTSQIFSELNLNVDDFYFSVHKISPFVSQFVATKKDDIDKYTQIAQELECKLLGVFSYLPLISKYVSHNGNLIIITSYLGNIVVALSEINGIFFNNKYGSFKDSSSIKEMVENLRVFKSTTKNNRIISFNFENPEASKKLGISELQVENEYGYKNPIHNLADKVLNEEYINSTYNLLNAYFVKSKEAKKTSKVTIAVSLIIMMMFGSVWGYTTYFDNNFLSKLSVNVLGDTTSSEPEVKTEPAPVLNKLPESTAELKSSIPTSSVNSTPTKVTITPSVTVTPTPSTTQTQASANIKVDGKDEVIAAPSDPSLFKRDILKVNVINTTGITGFAKKHADFLTVLGYKSVTTGTTNTPQTGTLVKIKPSLGKYKDQIMKDMLTFKDLKIEETLVESSTLDMVVILGK